MATHKVGDQVTILPPYDRDPILVSMQPFAKITRVDGPAYMVVLGSTMPADLEFGPFTAARLAAGWRDSEGKWLRA